MNRLFIIRKKYVYLTVVFAALLVLAYLFATRGEPEQLTMTASGGLAPKDQVIHMVTGEFKATLPNGQKLEAYRWDPGTIVVNKGQKTTLSIYGVNGEDHPFMIEGMDISGEAKQGQETLVTFTPQQEGIFRLICLNHPDKTNKGPMIAYIVVQ